MSTAARPAPRLRRIYPDTGQIAVRSVVVIGTMAVLVASAAAGGRVPGWVQVLLLGLALVTAGRPESGAGVVLLLGSSYAWVVVPEPLSAWVLLAAGGLLLVHVAALIAAQGPARMPVDPVQLARWAGRGLLLWCVAAGVWCAALLLDETSDQRLAYAAGLVLLAALGVLVTTMVGSRGARQ